MWNENPLLCTDLKDQMGVGQSTELGTQELQYDGNQPNQTEEAKIEDR